MFSQKIFYKRLSLIIAILLMLVIFSSCGGTMYGCKMPLSIEIIITGFFIGGLIIFFIIVPIISNIYPNLTILRMAPIEWGILCIIISISSFSISTLWYCKIKKSDNAEIAVKPDFSEKANSSEKKEGSPNQSESESKLRAKISDIRRIRQELTQKRGEAVKTKEQYWKDVDSYKNEINQVRGNLKISSYQGASGNHRIKGNIMLIQQRLAYIQSIEEIQSGIEAGIESLTTTERKIEGDLIYIKLLDKEKQDKLSKEAASVIDANKQYMGEFVIKVDENKLKSPEKIWDEIVSGNL